MRPRLPIELIDPPDRRVKNMAVGEKAEIPFYSLDVTPSREFYIRLDQRLQEGFVGTQMVQIERLRRGLRLYLPADLKEKAKSSKEGYLRIPWRWFLGIKPVVEVVFQDRAGEDK
jgi:hypothetical protein